ncbi:MAG: high frequency lysogenization protein [Pseudohongiellaceae bacterium]
MANDLKGQTIALAAMFQFSACVEQLAKTGHVNQKDFEVSVNSLFNQNPADTLEIYGGIEPLATGLSFLIANLSRSPERSSDCIRYVMGILHLQKQLSKKPSMLNMIAKRLNKSRLQVEHFSIIHENVIAGLADVYTDTISTFNFRIQVTGEYQFLQQTRIANQIRTLLFAGVRSAVLWRQLGGNRLKAIYQRTAILEVARSLQKEIQQRDRH